MNFIKNTIKYLCFPVVALINLLHFLTVLPMPRVPYLSLAKSALMIPFAGFMIGALVAGFYYGFYLLNLPPFLCAVLAVSMQIIITGGLHEDGLADTADALGVRGGDGAYKLQKTRENYAVGAYGMLGLLITFVGKTMLLTSLANPYQLWIILPITHMLSRAGWVLFLQFLPLAKGSVLGQMIENISKMQFIFALIFSIAITIIWLGYFGLNILAPYILLFWIAHIYVLTFFIRKKFGGISGDVLGASQQIGEFLLILFYVIIIFLPNGSIFQ